MISNATPWPLTSGIAVSVVGDWLMTRSHVPGSAWSNCAVQLLAALIVTEVRGAVPPQAPLQPANIEPGSGAAVSVTAMPIG
jgi:hypothetical protein